MVTARAYLPEGRIAHDLARLRAETARLLEVFTGAGATEVEPAALLDAETLLDLYGEDIRTRAYTTQDPVEGERMLRPDFTVPVVQMHVAMGQEPARYAYAGPVWRRQEPGSERATEYLQVGYELFDRGNAQAGEAEVFGLITGALSGQGLTISTGDLGVLRAAVASLRVSDRRRATLMRHIWRPARFAALVARFASPMRTTETRAALLDAARAGEAALDALITAAGPEHGVRSRAEISARAAWLADDASEAPLSQEEQSALDAVGALTGTVAAMPDALTPLSEVLPGLTNAAERIALRNEAFAARGIDPAALPFSARFGQTTLEYYDGFVFGLSDPARPDLPPIASGGRYDALTRALGEGIPAVGGIIRPEALLAGEAAR